jgi:hypothetical protein
MAVSKLYCCFDQATEGGKLCKFEVSFYRSVPWEIVRIFGRNIFLIAPPYISFFRYRYYSGHAILIQLDRDLDRARECLRANYAARQTKEEGKMWSWINSQNLN